MPIRITVSTSLLMAALVLATPCTATANQAPVVQQAAFPPEPHHAISKLQERQWKEKERAAVGQPFPLHLKAYDTNGNEVTMRKLLHGPAIVIQMLYHSPFSGAILDFLRENGAIYANQHHTQVVVLLVNYMDDNYADKLKGLPDNIIALHATGSLAFDIYKDQIIGGHTSPTIVFLNKQLDVVDRRMGTYGTPKETLSRTDVPGGH